MARQIGTPKTCNRCGRSGSHAFRRTPDGLYECTTTTACRVRARRGAGTRQDGRGRLPRSRGFSGAGPGVAYVIGEDLPQRGIVGEAVRDLTGLAVVIADPSKATLTALGSRNVKLIAIDAECLEPIGFRNEFELRCRQPRLSSVPIFVFGRHPEVASNGLHLPDATLIAYDRPADIRAGLRRRVAAIGADAPDAMAR